MYIDIRLVGEVTNRDAANAIIWIIEHLGKEVNIDVKNESES